MRRFPTDILLAIVVLILTGALAWRNLAVVMERIPKDSNLVEKLIPGEYAQQLTSGARCIGSLRSTFAERSGEFALVSEGKIRIKLGGTEYEPNLHAELYFNAVGYLGGSVLTLHLGETRFRIGTYNIRPIVLKVRVNGPLTSYEHAFTVPGPVQLIRNRDRSFRIEYPALRGLEQTARQVGSQPVFRNLQLSYRSVPPGEQECPPGEASSLDLTDAVFGAQTLLSRFKVLPEPMPPSSTPQGLSNGVQ